MTFFRSLRAIFTFFSVLLTIAVLIGAYMDYKNLSPDNFDTLLDDTRELVVTETGLVQRGRVVDNQLDCSNGMIYIEIYKFQIPFRTVSSTGIDLEKPREACRDQGFAPTF